MSCRRRAVVKTREILRADKLSFIAVSILTVGKTASRMKASPNNVLLEIPCQVTSLSKYIEIMQPSDT